MGRQVSRFGDSCVAAPFPSETSLCAHCCLQPIVVIGNISCVVSATLFGLADSYETAVVARVLGGLFNGIIGGEYISTPFALLAPADVCLPSWFEFLHHLAATCRLALLCSCMLTCCTLSLCTPHPSEPGPSHALSHICSRQLLCLACLAAAEKAMFGEALDSIGQGIAFSYFSIAWGLGALAGPLLGGVFAKPCSGLLEGTAVCSPDSLLQRR